MPLRARHSHQLSTLSSGVKCPETLTMIKRAGQMEATTGGVRGGRTGKGAIAPFARKELRTLKAMTKGDVLVGKSTSNQATTLRRIPEVRVGELVAERVQVGDVGNKFTDGVSKSLV
eukprot:787128-Pleurochrysis_carterae.AAC.3